MRLACGEVALRRAGRDAFAYRCGGSTGWLDCGAGRLPVSRLTAHAGSAREHRNACECRRRCEERQGETGCRGMSGMAAAARPGSRPGPPQAPARRVRAGRALCYRMRRVRCSRALLRRAQLNGKQEAEVRPACAVPATVRRPRVAVPRTRPGRPRCHCPSAGGKAAAWQAASPDTGRRKGRARCSPNARSAGDGWGALSARARAGFARSVMHCLSAGRRCAAHCPLSTATTRCAPCRAR